jgi:hypothetical protein
MEGSREREERRGGRREGMREEREGGKEGREGRRKEREGGREEGRKEEKKEGHSKSGMVADTYNPNTWKAEARGLP